MLYTMWKDWACVALRMMSADRELSPVIPCGGDSAYKPNCQSMGCGKWGFNGCEGCLSPVACQPLGNPWSVRGGNWAAWHFQTGSYTMSSYGSYCDFNPWAERKPKRQGGRGVQTSCCWCRNNKQTEGMVRWKRDGEGRQMVLCRVMFLPDVFGATVCSSWSQVDVLTNKIRRYRALYCKMQNLHTLG